MKHGSSLWPVLCACGSLALGLIAGTAADRPATNAPALDAQTSGLSLQQAEIETGARFTLLKELAAQHSQRAEQATRATQPDKAKWEEALAKELSERVDQEAAALAGLIRQRLGTEQTTKAADATAAKLPNPDETAFLTRLDTQLWQVEQDIKAATEVNSVLSAQLQTNNSPDDILRTSFSARENNVLMRSLERERSQLELEKLQYRALKERSRTKN